MFFGKDFVVDVNTNDSLTLKVFVQGDNLILNKNLNGETLELYSVLGEKVQSSIINNGQIILNNYPQGVYIVRVGNFKQKITL